MLRCLAVYAERLPRLFEQYSDSVRVFLLHKARTPPPFRTPFPSPLTPFPPSPSATQLLRPGEDGSSPPVLPTMKSRGRGKNNKGHADRLSAECRRTVAAIKLLVAHVLGLRARQPEGEEEAGPSQDADASVASAAGTRRRVGRQLVVDLYGWTGGRGEEPALLADALTCPVVFSWYWW